MTSTLFDETRRVLERACRGGTRLASSLDLARLPYFTLREGRLAAANRDAIWPAADVHAHLALGLNRLRVDLHAGHGAVRHYLPQERPLDLDAYMNRNFTEGDLRRLKLDLTVSSLGAGGMRATHTVPNLLGEMRDLGLAATVLLPIEFRVLSENAEIYLDAVAGEPGLVTLGSVHPQSPGAAERLARQKARGARGVKIHPAVQGIRPDHPAAMALYPVCADLGLPVLFHAGPVGIEGKRARERCRMVHYARPIAENPRTRFVLGHSGALEFEEALALARAHDNCWLETASQGLSNVCRVVAEGPPDRIMHGSDWPFYHQAPSLAKALLATEGRPGARRRLLWENAARLFALEPPAA